jgi:hypothetical protein
MDILEARMRSPDIDNKGLEPLVAPPEELVAAVSRVPAELYEAPPESITPAPLPGWYGQRAKLMGAEYLSIE